MSASSNLPNEGAASSSQQPLFPDPFVGDREEVAAPTPRNTRLERAYGSPPAAPVFAAAAEEEEEVVVTDDEVSTADAETPSDQASPTPSDDEDNTEDQEEEEDDDEDDEAYARGLSQYSLQFQGPGGTRTLREVADLTGDDGDPIVFRRVNPDDERRLAGLPPEVVDLTGDSDEEDEGEEPAAKRRRVE